MKKYRCKKILLIVLTALYMVVVYLYGKYNVEDLSIVAGSVLMGSILGIPIILILCMRECINTLVEARMKAGEALDSKERKKVIKCKLVMWGLAIIVFKVLSHTYFYILSCLNRMDRFILPILILIIILLCWLFFAIWCENNFERLIHNEDKKKTIIRICLCVVLIILTQVGYIYADTRTYHEVFMNLQETNY